jgi:hypothetical protein
MNKIIYCRNAQKINQSNDDKNLERHFAECAECRKSQEVFDWMRELAAQTAPPQNLHAPGFLLFKAKLIEKQSAAARAVQPIVRMQIASAVIFASAIAWLLVKSQPPFGSLLKETFLSLSSVAPLFILAAASAVLICFAFAYFLRETKKFKK